MPEIETVGLPLLPHVNGMSEPSYRPEPVRVCLVLQRNVYVLGNPLFGSLPIQRTTNLTEAHFWYRTLEWDGLPKPGLGVNDYNEMDL